MRKNFILALLFSLLCFQVQGEAKVLRVAIDEYYPPFSYPDEQTKEYTGFDVEIAKALCKEANLDCEIVPVPFDSFFTELSAGNLDIGVLGLGRSPERAKVAIFTNRYYRSSSVFLEIPGSVEISKEGLTGKKIAVQGASVQEDYLRKNYGDIATIVTFPGYDDVLDALRSKEVDVAFIDGLPVYYKLMNDPGMTLDFVGAPVQLTDDSLIVLRPSLTHERDLLNKAIDAIRKSGEYDRINRKYFNFNIY